jgi:hypothetical protein
VKTPPYSSSVAPERPALVFGDRQWRKKVKTTSNEDYFLGFIRFAYHGPGILCGHEFMVSAKSDERVVALSIFFGGSGRRVLDVICRYTQRAKSTADDFARFRAICLLVVLLRESSARKA